jgi:hypothetical protein
VTYNGYRVYRALAAFLDFVPLAVTMDFDHEKDILTIGPAKVAAKEGSARPLGSLHRKLRKDDAKLRKLRRGEAAKKAWAVRKAKAKS